MITVIANAWMQGHRPSLKSIVASYGEDLANKLSKDHKVLVTSPCWKKAFPELRIDPQKNTESEFHTTARGMRKGLSLFGPLTGRGADIIFIDDPHKGTEVGSPAARQRVIDAYENGVASRLNDKENGIIIVVMQRLHEEDLTGYLIEKGGFTVISLPAIAIQDERIPMSGGRAFVRRKGELLCPALLNQAGLDNARRDHGVPAYESQYQQNPSASGANIVDWGWLRSYERPTEPYLYIFQSWDIAITDGPGSDYSACATFGFTGEHLHLLEVFRGKLRFHALLDKIQTHRTAWRAHNVVVECANSGEAVCQELLRVRGFPLIRWAAPTQGKEVRLSACTGYLERGVVQIPRQAHWLDPFYKELMAFPSSRHDDQVDAFSQALEFARYRLDVLVDTLLHNGRRSTMTLGRRRRKTLRERVLDAYDKNAPSLF